LEQQKLEGFNVGFSEGYAQWRINLVESQEIEEETLTKYVTDFTGWVDNQKINKNEFSCDSDIRLELPFPEDERMFAIWANHDCQDYTLYLTLLIAEDEQRNLVGYNGAELSRKGCVQADTWSSGMLACEFELPASGDNFGILFKGGVAGVFYTQDWI